VLFRARLRPMALACEPALPRFDRLFFEQVLVGPRVPSSVLRTAAAAAGSPYHAVPGGPFDDFDVENSAIAAAALRLVAGSKGLERLTEVQWLRIAACCLVFTPMTPTHRMLPPPVPPTARHTATQSAIMEGVSSRPPCRFEEFDVSATDPRTATLATSVQPAPGCVRVVLDVGHNPPALEQLTKKLKATFPTERLRVVLGMCRDKDIMNSLHLLFGKAATPKLDISHVHLVQAAHPRASSAHGILQALLVRRWRPLSLETFGTRSPLKFFLVALCACRKMMLLMPTALRRTATNRRTV